jgi:hypothetical protein
VKREPLVLAFALVFPSLMAWLYFVVASPGADATHANPVMQWLYAAGKLVQFGLPVLWIVFIDPSSLRFTRPKTAGLRSGLVFGLLVASIAFAIYQFTLANSPLMDGVGQRIRAKLAEFDVDTPIRFLVLAGFLAGINSFLEEYYWRWFVFGRLRRWAPLVAAIPLSSLGFMGHHVIVLSVYFPERLLTAVLPFSLAIAVGGAAWAWIYYRAGSIIGPWLSHLIVDLAIMTIGYDLAFRQ